MPGLAVRTTKRRLLRSAAISSESPSLNVSAANRSSADFNPATFGRGVPPSASWTSVAAGRRASSARRTGHSIRAGALQLRALGQLTRRGGGQDVLGFAGVDRNSQAGT